MTSFFKNSWMALAPGGRGWCDPPVLPITVRELIRELERDGWYLVRRRGSHRQFHHPTKPGTVTIAGSPGLEMHPKTLGSVLRQAGLRR